MKLTQRQQANQLSTERSSSRMKNQKVKTIKAIEAEAKSAHWLAEANAAHEDGNRLKESLCISRSQYWLDIANKARGNS